MQRRQAKIGRAAALLLTAALALAPALPAGAEVTQGGAVRVSVRASLSPKRLPRARPAPVAVSFSGHITPTVAGALPQLQRLVVSLNAHGALHRRGLPLCHLGEIQPATSKDALIACRRSLVGEGSFSSEVKIVGQSPFPSKGKVLAFNGALGSRPAILAHIYGTVPAPTSYVLPFLIRHSRGTYGTSLEASFPQVTGEWGYVTGISMRLQRSFRYRGKSQSYLDASCPAPAGFPGVSFPLAATSFLFADGAALKTTLTRRCRVGG